MNVLQFTIPVPGNQNIILKNETGSSFYAHLHRHDEVQLTWIQKGEGTLVVNNGMYPFQSNQVFFIGANQPHVFRSDPSYFNAKSKRQIKALTVFFNPAGKLKHLFELVELKPIQQLLKKHPAGFIIPEKQVQEVAYKMNKLFQQTDTERLVGFIELLAKLASITDLKKLAHKEEVSVVSENEGIRISNIYHYIMLNYHQQITLEQVAEKANMTPQAFCRYFKKRTLKTFVSFLNEVRINEACNRLTQDNFDGIATVAYNCGFNSITHFNRVFKTIVGQSPGEYINNYNKHTFPAGI